jgi:hypothetical protein
LKKKPPTTPPPEPEPSEDLDEQDRQAELDALAKKAADDHAAEQKRMNDEAERARLNEQAERQQAEEETERLRKAQAKAERVAGDGMPAAAPATFQVSVYLLPAAAAAAEQLRRRRSSQNAAIAFDALDRYRDELRNLIADRKTSAVRPSGSMFPNRMSNSTRSAAAQQGRRQLWSLQATEDELTILDQLAADSGASSRSELISVAMEAHLLSKRKSR